MCEQKFLYPVELHIDCYQHIHVVLYALCNIILLGVRIGGNLPAAMQLAVHAVYVSNNWC